MLFAAAPYAQSQMYRWIDAQGAVTYSNQLPSDMSIVRDLTVVLDNPGTVTSRDPRGEQQRQGAAPPPAVGATGGSRDALEAFSRPGASELPPLVAPPGTPDPAPRISISPNAPEAVRDPCLRSSDPKCYERNRDAYVPGHGYSPSAARASKETATGGTSGAAAIGAVAGGSPPPGPGKLTAPPSSTYALPPGSEPIPAVTSRKR